MTETTITGGRCIAEMWKGYGVSHVFFVDAILRRAMVEAEELGIKRILTHSEKAAAYMADGYARVSGRPGFCASQSVGAANLASGLQDPWLAASPVIAMTGAHAMPMQYRNAYQELDHAQLFSGVTKFHAKIETPEQLPFLMRQAFREATTGTPRPVHLDIVNHTGELTAAASRAYDTTCESEYAVYPAHRPLPDPAAIKRAAAAIKASQRPVVVADRGAIICGARDEIATLARKIGAPVVVSLDAKGIFDEGDAIYGGAVGTYGSSAANHIVCEADLVIFAGSNTGDMTTHAWRVPKPGVKVIQIDIDPIELGRNYAGTIGILADVAAGLAALAAEAPKTARKEWLAQAKAHYDDWNKVVAALPQQDQPMWPSRLCRELTEILPKDAIVFSDTGYSAQWSGNMIGIRHPTQMYHRAAGSLGWSFPAALGGKCAAPDRPVVVFTGDGGFYYHALELETARRWGINVVVVLNNNGGLAQGQRTINSAYGNRAGRKQELYEFGKFSFEKFAQLFDCHGATVEKASDFPKAFKAALASNKPAVIDVRTEFTAIAPDPWLPA
jgi:acetolactate synthase-1/2/3 large subunit